MKGKDFMNDVQLKYFLAAAKYENFTKAAETMFVAQPVLGRHISNLEKELGFTLFERSRKTVKLTENGRIFEEFAKNTFERFDAMMHQVQENQRCNEMNLKIGSVDGQRVENYFAPALKHIVEHYPHMTISIKYYHNTEKLFDAIHNGDIDTAISGYELVNELRAIFMYKKIRITKGCFVVPISHPLAKKETITSEDVKDVCFILRSEDSKHSRDLQLEIANRYGITNFVSAPNLSTLTTLVKSGIGITTVPDNYELCFDPGIKRIYIPNGHSFIECLIWKKDNRNPAIHEFCKVLDETGCSIERDG